MSYEFKHKAFSVSSAGITASIFVVVLNIRLLWKFQNSPIRKKPEYHLYQIRFFVDICYSIAVSIYYVALDISYLSPFFLFHYKILFVVTLLSSNILSTRFFLAALISIERLIAVFLPVQFHNNRQKLPVFIFFTMLLLWGMFEDVMYFWICDISPFIKDCSVLGCTYNDCFLQYWTGSKLVIGGFTCLSSLVLFFKLLALKKTMNIVNLSKTNYLCIGDSCLTLLFDFTPFLLTLVLRTQLYSADIYGPYNATAKSTACFIDAMIATWVLKKPLKPTQIRQINSLKRISDRHGSSRT